MTEIIDRAINAYSARQRKLGAIPTQPSRSDSGVREHAGREYAVLENTHGILAVYRMLNSGRLKYLKRWPSALTA